MAANLLSGPACISFRSKKNKKNVLNIRSFTVDMTKAQKVLCKGRLINNVKPDQLEQPDMDSTVCYSVTSSDIFEIDFSN